MVRTDKKCFPRVKTLLIILLASFSSLQAQFVEGITSLGTNKTFTYEETGRSFCRAGAYNTSIRELFLCGTAIDGSSWPEILMMKNKTDLPVPTNALNEQSQQTFSMRLGAGRIWIDNPHSATGNATLNIYDLQGKPVKTEAIYIDGLGTTIVSFAQTLKPGIYVSTLQVGKVVYSNTGLVR